MKKSVFSALMCLCLLLTLLPTTAFAAGGTVKIEGIALSSATPYYYNDTGSGSSTQPYPTKNNDGTTHYNAYFDSANDTLHLRYLQVGSGKTGGVIEVSGISTLYIKLEDSTNNNVNCTALDAGAVGIHAPGTKLVIYGDGRLTVNAANSTSSIGISAAAIELQYPAELEVKAGEQATSVAVTAISGTYDAKGGNDVSTPPTENYNFSNGTAATAYKFIQFSKQSNPAFPVWVDSTQIDGSYINGKSAFGGTVTYTPARGAASAKLTLDGVTIDERTIRGIYTAGVYAESYPLRLCLKNSNTIEISAPKDTSVTPCGVYSEKALTVEAEPDASLTANISLAQGSLANPKPPCAVRADGGITLDGCAVILPDGGRISGDGKFISGSDGTTLLGYAKIGLIPVGFTNLTADGSAAASTTALTLTFDKDVAGLTADDITVTGATKGTLTKESGTGVYTLAISNITVADGGTVNVAVAKTDFAFTPTNKDVAVRKYTPPATFDLTVNLNGGNGGTTGGDYAENDRINIDAGTKENYSFNGWTTSNGGTFDNASHVSTFFTMPGNAVTVKANWSYTGGGDTTDYYTLTFNTNSGSAISSITRAEYTTIDLTLSRYIPTREGYEFTGWYSDAVLTNKITSIRLTGNTTIYAGWEDKTNPNTGVDNPFTDVSENDWFFDDVMFVYGNKLMLGTSATTFSPTTTTTRGMIVTILYRLVGEPETTGACPFADVKSGSYYEKAITWAAANGIVGGYGNGKFGPDDSITREQLAAILYRYEQYKGGGFTGNWMFLLDFSDRDKVSDYAYESVCWMTMNGIINGRSNGTFDPQGNATRAEAAAMLHRFCEKIAE